MVKTQKEISYIKESCKIVGDVFRYIEKYIKPGITTKEIDLLIEDYIRSKDGYPAFKGYKVKGNEFPASSCISINEEVVHGIPCDRKLTDGDIVSIDIGVVKNGYYGDSAYTFPVGIVNEKKQRLLKITKDSLYAGIQNARDNGYVNDISIAVQEYVESNGFSVVRELVGHGVGKNLHEEPPIPNYYYSGNRYKLKAGMTIAIEPMVNYGSYKIKLMPDKWTYVTIDGEPSAHFEHTILITKSQPEILTNSL